MKEGNRLYRVLLAEDDVLNRVAIKSLIDWNALGFEIYGVVENGKEALDILEQQTVHVVITDIKMPIMNGLELIQKIRERDLNLEIIVLSSYDDFELVRSAFKHNIEDYILKNELTPQRMTEYLCKIKEKFERLNITGDAVREDELKAYIKGNELVINCKLEKYYCVIVSVCDVKAARRKISGYEQGFLSVLSEIIKQMPNIRNRSDIADYTDTSILICYKTEEISTVKLESLCRQIIQVIKAYSNIDVYIGVSDWTERGKDLRKSIQKAVDRSTFFWIFGKESVFLEDEIDEINLMSLFSRKKEYSDVMSSFELLDDDKLFDSQSNIFREKIYEDIAEVKKRCLELIYYEATMLVNIGDNIWSAWNSRVNFKEKLDRLTESASVIMWITNFNCWIMDYLKNISRSETGREDMDIILRYIKSNYNNSNLSLNEVASIIGLNERYFSSKFKKELGITYVEYVTNIRVEASKNLLKNTNMKLTEISAAVGYNNVEHFVRVFKKKIGYAPREYGKKM